MTRAAIAAAALALTGAGCVVDDRDVLVVGPVLETCEDAAGRVSDHQSCDFIGVCALPIPPSPACCAELVACTGGSLSVHPYCDDGCATCTTDAECTPGERFCDGTLCTPCADPSTCDTCPMGTVPLQRNGCATCECGPASQCDSPDGAVCDPNGMLECYPGQRCGTGCQPGDAGCCINVCAEPGCASPAPLGCDTPCPAMLNCQSCQTTACTCDGMVWTCDAVCAPTTDACFFPRS